MQAGFTRREDRAWEKVATLGIWVLSPYSKDKHMTPTKLLGRYKLQTLPPRPASWGEDERELAAEKARRLAEAIRWAVKK